MACLQIYRELLSPTTILRVHLNSKDVFYLSWQNTYPNSKTTCHIKLKFFLRTKLLENLLLAKYLISVTARLISYNSEITELELNDTFDQGIIYERTYNRLIAQQHTKYHSRNVIYFLKRYFCNGKIKCLRQQKPNWEFWKPGVHPNLNNSKRSNFFRNECKPYKSKKIICFEQRRSPPFHPG